MNPKEYLRVTEIAEHFDIEPKELNNIFVSMGWVVSSDEGYILQERGEENGGLQLTDGMYNPYYVRFEESIKKNENLKFGIKNFFAPPTPSKIIKERDYQMKLHEDIGDKVTLLENSYDFYIERGDFKALMQFEEPKNYAYDKALNWVDIEI